MSIKIKFNAEKCVGCYACHIACLDAHHEVDEADAKSFRAIREKYLSGLYPLRKMYGSLSGTCHLP